MKYINHTKMALAILVGILISGVFYTHEAKAARGCYGELVATQDIRGNIKGENVLLGVLKVYYRPENGGTNIACLIRQGKFVGIPLHTHVSIKKCGIRWRNGSGCERTSRPVKDEGLFKYYAGPVSVRFTNRRCVNVFGHVQIPKTRYAYYYSIGPLDCGMKDFRFDGMYEF